ncbi:MAG: plasmid maintenance system antidote protein, family [Bacteroidetes bacterium]|nr:plasmid maintenance system antidote protein, family [Bacteroidota bacterium]
MITLKGVDPRMIANNLTPFEPTHPGEILKGEIEYRGISQRKLARQMGVSYSVMHEVLNAKRPVTTEYALLFDFSERLAKIRQLAAML